MSLLSEISGAVSRLYSYSQYRITQLISSGHQHFLKAIILKLFERGFLLFILLVLQLICIQILFLN